MARLIGRRAIAGLAVAAALIAGCSGPKSATGDTTGGGSAGTGGSGTAGTVNVYLYQEPAGVFSPLAPSSGPDNQVMSFIFQGLLGVDPKYKLQPLLADSYEVSPDATTFTFHLRKGLKWSDGTPFTSKDVLFTYQLLANPKSGSATAGSFSGVAGVPDFVAGKTKTISGLSAPDPNTFVIKASAPDFGLLAQIGTVNIIPQHILGQDSVTQVAKDKFFRSPTVGIGPYSFVSYKTNQYVQLKANPTYRSKVAIKNIYLKPLTSDVATAQLGNGGIDIASISPTDLKTVQGLKDVGVQESPGAGFIRIGLNQSQSRFKDARVRQAFAYAINRKQIVQSVLAGKGLVQNSDFYQDNQPSGLNSYGYNPGKAKSLLKAAGWDSSKTVELEWIPGQRDRDSTATIVQNELQAVGVKVKLKQVQAAQILPSYEKKSYDMVLFGGGNYAVDSWNVDVIVDCAQQYPAGGNIVFFCDPVLDKLMKKANATTDETARKKLYDQAAIEENKQASYLWLYDPMGLWAVNKRVKGFVAAGSQDAGFWNPGSWSIAG